MFETNIENNSGRISLARASQLTGYHQDYLGQLCRLGKLDAVKVGRNWFTSPEALNNLSASAASPDLVAEELDEVEQVLQELEEPSLPQPFIAENITISEVDGMPVAIRTLPIQARNTNSVQNILTNLRIESLQQEVLELRRLLFRLMDEVKSHTNVLQTRDVVNRVQDSLRHSYVSNFDFNAPEVNAQRIQLRIAQEESDRPAFALQKPHRKNYVLVNWVAATAAIVVLSFIGIGIATTSFLGQQPATTSLYYREAPQQNNQPEVAGAAEENSNSLPTDSTGEIIPLMIR